jgi:hypothetical protein
VWTPSGSDFSWIVPSLSQWFQSLLDRDAQIRSWLAGPRPLSYWLPGFFNPSGFLTAMKQEVARMHKREDWYVCVAAPSFLADVGALEVRGLCCVCWRADSPCPRYVASWVFLCAHDVKLRLFGGPLSALSAQCGVGLGCCVRPGRQGS